MGSISAGKPSPGVGSVTVDLSRAPLLQIRFIGMSSDEAFEGYLREYAAFLRRGPYAAVYDARRASFPPASQRKRQADWIREHADTIQQNCAGIAFCTSSPWIRGAITAVFWLQPPPSPYVVVDDIVEAEQWACEQLAAFVARKA